MSDIKKEDLAQIANTIRTLSIDAIQKANSGHPGMPMGCADIAAVLWCKILNYNPEKPNWINRDRFVLSAGHGSMLLYSILHLCGYNISLDDIKDFRQLNSITPGHPEYGQTPGVEVTSGPLGQGFANAVGMALSSKLLAKEFNTDNESIIDHYVYTLTGDGCIMEGISSEAASIAGHLGLGNLICIYDYNKITIEGCTDLTFSEDIQKRFISYNWHVQEIDGHNLDEVEKSILNAQKENGKPSIIISHTKIAKGSPNKEGSESTHGAPLGDDEIKETKINIGCDAEAKFHVPDKVYDIFKDKKNELLNKYEKWDAKFKQIITGDIKTKWDRFFSKPEIESLRKKLPVFKADDKIATRGASGKVLEAIFNELPNIIGGSADLGPSNKSFVKGFDETGKNQLGRNIHFGVREHAMGAIQNGISYYGGFIPYSATFFAFIDYMRPAVRLAALAKLNTIYIFSHDSIFVGEDGPTHQAIEHLASARAIPDLTVIRPADGEETREAWLNAINSNSPTALILTRQNIPIIERNSDSHVKNLHRGAYIIWDPGQNPDILLLASGSEVHISIDAAKELKEKGINARVISFPSWELFEKQPADYKKKILPDAPDKKIVIEAGIKMGWERYAGQKALYITMDKFGSSAPASVLAKKYGFSKENIVSKSQELVKK